MNLEELKKTVNKIYLTLVLIIFNIPFSEATNKVGEICHIEAEYYYPGKWEKYNEDELICNYWQFLGLEEFESDNISDSEYIKEENEWVPE